MNSEQRREQVLHLLKEKSQPLSASAIAKEFGVSRQIIVGDVALLRASGHDIAATPADISCRKAKTDECAEPSPAAIGTNKWLGSCTQWWTTAALF